MALQAADLKITVESPAAWARRLRITVPASRVEAERKAATQKLAGQVRLPGFRKGKVPTSVMQKKFGAAIEQQAIERVMGDAYRVAIQQEGLQPITDGSIDNVNYQAGADLTFDVGFEIRPVVELNRLGGFRVRRPVVAIADQQIDEVVDRLREEQAVWQPLEEGMAPADRDAVTVELTPLDDEDGSAKPRSYDIFLGDGQTLPAVEAVVRTLRPGQEGEFTVDLPERPDDPDSPTKSHRLHIRMTEARRPELPVADDAFARSLGEFEDLASLRSRVRADLEMEAEREAERAVRQQLAESIVDANPFEVPHSMVDTYVKQLVPDREGADPDRLAEIRQSAHAPAERAIRRMLAIDRIADMESLAVTPPEIDEKVSVIAERLGRSPAEVKAQLRKNGRLDELAHEITENKVFEYLKPLSTIENEA